MGYSKEYAYGKVNTSNAAELMKCCRPELNGDCQVIANGLAADTGFTSGDPVGLTPTASGWLVDSLTTNLMQRWGIVQNTPQAAGGDVRVCVGGFTYANWSTAQTCTAWAQTVEFTSDTLYCAATSRTTNHVGWVVSSGSLTTAGAMIFMDVPWPFSDISTV